MSVVLLLSLGIHIAALVLSLVVLWRLKDWRIVIFAAMISLMILHEGLLVAGSATLLPPVWSFDRHEFTELAIGVLALISVYVFGRMMEKKIRDRKVAEDARSRLVAIFDTAVSAIITSDESGVIEDFNPTAERMFGYSREECLGRNVSQLMPEPYSSAHDEVIASYLATGDKKIIGVGREIIAQRKDGSVFPIHLGLSEVKLPDRTIFTAMIEDMSARKEAESRIANLQDELIHVARLSAMGELSSAMAHELNQPLTAISNYAQTARRLLEQKAGKKNVKAATELLVKASDQALRAGEIIRRLRKFIVWGESERTFENVPDLVEEATKLALVGSSAKSIRFQMEADANVPRAQVDRIQIQQVIQNLVRNAADALENWDGEKGIVVHIESKSAGEVAISVRDTGPGLAQNVREHLFEPFVTTKENGMGIGLSVCHNIVEAHGGRIVGESDAKGGACFCVTLPVKQAGAKAAE